MKTLLQIFLEYFDLFYLEPSYRITDSRTSGAAQVDASLVISGPTLTWRLVNDRGQIQLAVAPSQLPARENWFWLSVIRQYLDGDEDTIIDVNGIEWLRNNVNRIEQLFTDQETAVHSCQDLNSLKEQIASRLFGPA